MKSTDKETLEMIEEWRKGNSLVANSLITNIERLVRHRAESFINFNGGHSEDEFLQWIYGRMVEVHGENENIDYMHKLKLIAFKAKPQPKCKYEKLTRGNFNVWDLKELLATGELFHESDGSYVAYVSSAPSYMIGHFIDDGVYRKVEVDPVEELAKKFNEVERGVNSSVYEWDELTSFGKDGYKAMAQYVIDHKEEL